MLSINNICSSESIESRAGIVFWGDRRTDDDDDAGDAQEKKSQRNCSWNNFQGLKRRSLKSATEAELNTNGFIQFFHEASAIQVHC